MEKFTHWLQVPGIGFEFAASAAMNLWPDQIWIAWILFAVGLVLIFWPFFQWLFNRLGVSWPSQYILLSEAAKIAYEETYQSLAEGFAESMGQNPLEWYAIALVANNDIPLFGCKPHQTIKREIPKEDMPRYHIYIRDGDSYLKGYADDHPSFINLHMRKKDLKKQIKEIKSWG